MQKKNETWLKVVGIGEDGLKGISPRSRILIKEAEVLFGGSRHLEMVPEGSAERISWAHRMKEAVPNILELKGRKVVVLASGDPLCYGIGAKLLRHLDPSEVEMIPSRNSFSLACARMGWSFPDIETMTIHGRPVAMLHTYVYPNSKILCLSENASSPREVAELLLLRGYGLSRITVLENMGGPNENSYGGEAHDWKFPEGSGLNTLAIECIPDMEPELLSRNPGLPDSAFNHDGKLTKQDIRAVTLVRLMPFPDQLLWDVGAGCGSVAIEWMRAHPRCKAIAIERSKERLAMLRKNSDALGVPLLEVVEGEAPSALSYLKKPDAVFIGGGLSTRGLLEYCWEALRPLGRLVSNAVTLEGEQVLMAWHQSHPGELTRINISNVEALGTFQGWRPIMPVTQYSAVKK